MMMSGIKVVLHLCFFASLAVAEFGPEIVGGTPAGNDTYPFFAIPDVRTTDFVCGATVIYEDILLTIAGCTLAWTEDTTAVITPSGGLFDETPDETHEVDFVVAHPQFRARRFASDFLNDIMLVKLATSTDVTPVVLNTESSVPAVGETVKTIGFGLTTGGGELSPELLEVDIDVRSASDCEFDRNEEAAIICSGDIGESACQGDGGGPLLTQDNVQVGILSFTLNGCGDSTPDGFTRVSAYSQWIHDGICCLSSNPPSDCGRVNCFDYLGCPCGRFRFLCRLLNGCLF